MTKFFIFSLCFCLCIVAVASNSVYAEYNTAEEAVTEEITVEESISNASAEKSDVGEPEEVIELTKEEILTRIKTMSAYHPDIVALVPGLKAITSAEGVVSYEYNGEPLDSQDRDTLFGVLRIVNSHVSWKNVERTQRQLRNLRQIENQNRTDRMLRQQRRQSNR